MNVLIMADYNTPKSGNFIASLLELGNRMREQNKEVVFLFPQASKERKWVNWLRENEYKVYFLNDSDSAAEVFKKLSEIVSENHIRIIHSHFGYKHRILLENVSKISDAGVKILFHDHMDFSVDEKIWKQKLKNHIYALLYRVKGIGVISVMENKNKSYFLSGKHLHWYVPNGLSLLRNEQETRTRDEIRRMLGISKNEKMCLFLGWDLKRKGIDVAVRAVNEYRQKKSENLILGILGIGMNKPSENAIHYIKSTTGIDADSEWIKYLDSVEDIFAYHRAVDVYLSSSRKEAFSYGLLESMSQNTPVVVSDIEGTRWAYQYDKCVSYPVEDYVACADALEKALRMGRRESNAQEIVREYGIDVWCEKVMKIYEQVLLTEKRIR